MDHNPFYDEEMKKGVWLGVLGLFVSVLSLTAQGAQNVLVVVNRNSSDSRAVGEYYSQKRSIPPDHTCSISVPPTETVDRATFVRGIRNPLAECLSRGEMQDRILFIVLTKGVPLRVQLPPQPPQQGHPKVEDNSVDSELALLYSEMLGVPSPLVKLNNPYFVRNSRGGEMVRFSHRDFYIYLVTRLDGYDLADVRALVDRGLKVSPEIAKNGRFVLDQKAEDSTAGNKWIADAASRLRAGGIPASRITLEPTALFLTGEDRVLGYASWGSNDSADRSRYLQNHWLPGAIMTEFVSTNARTFQRPPDNWNISTWKSPKSSFFHDSPQSLIGDAIHEGVTGVAGNVDEPFLDACVRPQNTLPAYVQGLNLAESFYSGMPFLNWKGVVIGDPLVSIAPHAALPAEDANPPRHAGLGLPMFFARHLVTARAHMWGETEEVAELLLIAESARRRQDVATARQSMERAMKLAPDSPRVLELMASVQPMEQALPLLKKVVEVVPQNASALNNLAYILALNNRAREALPYAARAADIAQGRDPNVLDTYGWVLYLLGQYTDACPDLAKAVTLQPSHPTLVYHLGACYIKIGKKAEGKAQLERALTLKPDPATAAAIRRAM